MPMLDLIKTFLRKYLLDLTMVGLMLLLFSLFDLVMWLEAPPRVPGIYRVVDSPALMLELTLAPVVLLAFLLYKDRQRH